MDLVKAQEPIKIYGAALMDFNKAYEEHKAYEKWYSSDMQNKTPDNAKKLHALKHDLHERIKSLEAIIILAGQQLEKELLNLGFVSN